MPKYTDISGRPVEVVSLVQTHRCRSTGTEKIKLFLQYRNSQEPARYTVLDHDSPLEHLKSVTFEGFVSSEYARNEDEVRLIGWERPQCEAYHPDLPTLRAIVKHMEKIEKAIEKARNAAAEAGLRFDSFGALCAAVAKLYGSRTFIEQRDAHVFNAPTRERGIGEIAMVANAMVEEIVERARASWRAK